MSGKAALREMHSLDPVRVLRETDPAAALAALEVHKETLPQEHLREEHEGIESVPPRVAHVESSRYPMEESSCQLRAGEAPS